MHTRKYVSIISGCIGLLVLSLLLMDWVVLLYLCPLILLLFFAVLWFSAGDVSLTATHHISHTNIFEDSAVTVTLTMKNTGRALRFIEIYDELPDRVIVENGSNYAVMALKENEIVTLIYEISCPLRGLYHIGPLQIREKDFFGLFYREITIEDTIELTVIPKLESIRDITMKSRVNPYPGLMQTRRAGIATEFHGVRAYTAGDSYKQINWKAFARWNNPMVNEFELESTTDIIIVLDARELQQMRGSVRCNPLEYGVRAATILTSHFLKRRDRVGLIVYGGSERDLTWIYPESGNTQLYKVIRGLVQTKAVGSFTFQAAMSTVVGHMIPIKSLIIFISSLEGDPSIVTAVETLQARNFSVLIISPSPLDIECSFQPGDTNYDLARRILLLHRNTLLTQLRSTGARVVSWNPSTPLALALKEVEQYQIRR